MRELDGQRVLVLGLGVSGRSAAAFCAARGARVVAADERPEREIAGLAELPPDVERALGRPFPDPAGFDLVVPSPGVPRVRWAGRARRAWGDLELCFRALAAPIAAVTGTNGKSTTVLLLEAMLRAAGLRARAAGNVGRPALELVGQALDVAILEVSSFQLEAVDAFRPRVAVVLNLSPDHLDRHGSLEAYAAAKARLLAGQRADDVAVLNFDDPRVREMARDAPGRVLFFSTRAPLEAGAWVDAGSLALREPGGPLHRAPLQGMRLVGPHNVENAAAALLAALALGAPPERAAGALASFSGLPHRAEVVAEVAGVTFVDDSKATNPGAALRSLESFSAPVVWIAGGRDKALDFGELAATAAKRARAAVLVGEAAPLLEAALAGRLEAQRAASLPDAVARAAALARPGDVVLLAPACSSLDQFRDYAERGECYQAAVRALAARPRA